MEEDAIRARLHVRNTDDSKSGRGHDGADGKVEIGTPFCNVQDCSLVVLRVGVELEGVVGEGGARERDGHEGLDEGVHLARRGNDGSEEMSNLLCTRAADCPSRHICIPVFDERIALRYVRVIVM